MLFESEVTNAHLATGIYTIEGGTDLKQSFWTGNLGAFIYRPSAAQLQLYAYNQERRNNSKSVT